ncbi:MAG: carbohydrate porin [Jejuia sp.]
MNKLILLSFIFASCYLVAQENEENKPKVELSLTEGVEPFLHYASIGATNVSGGLEQEASYSGQLYTGLKLNFETLLGWKGTRGKISMINRHGKGLEKEVGSIFEPLNLVGGQNTFLYDLNIEHDFGDKFSWKIGRTTTVDDFSVSQWYFYSLSNTINGVIRALLLDGRTTTFPFATWGTRFKYKPNAKHQFQIGVYQLSETVFDDTQNGLDFAFRDSDEVSVFSQYDWFGKIADRKTRIYAGANQVFGRFNGLDSNTLSEYFLRLYGHIDIDLTEGLNTFLTLAYSPHGEVAKLPFQSSLGLNWKGLVKSRVEDRILFFATIGTFSKEWATLQGYDTLSPEVVLEMGYRFQITDYFVLQPAVQYSINPGGAGVIDNAIIPGIWIEASF